MNGPILSQLHVTDPLSQKLRNWVTMSCCVVVYTTRLHDLIILSWWKMDGGINILMPITNMQWMYYWDWQLSWGLALWIIQWKTRASHLLDNSQPAQQSLYRSASWLVRLVIRDDFPSFLLLLFRKCGPFHKNCLLTLIYNVYNVVHKIQS